MYINERAKLIEMSETEHKAAMTYGTEEYKALREIRNDYPNFRIDIIKPKKGKTSQDKLNMATIKGYVKAHGTPEQKQNFLLISTPYITEEGVYLPPKSFFEIELWFRTQFPDYRKELDDYEVEIKRIFDDVEKIIKDAKDKAKADAREKAKKEAADFLAAS